MKEFHSPSAKKNTDPDSRKEPTLGREEAAQARAQGFNEFFEVDRRYVVVASLEALAEAGEIGLDKVSEAIGRYGLDAARPNPWEA